VSQIWPAAKKGFVIAIEPMQQMNHGVKATTSCNKNITTTMADDDSLRFVVRSETMQTLTQKRLSAANMHEIESTKDLQYVP
jgi:hypothetical protein